MRVLGLFLLSAALAGTAGPLRAQGLTHTVAAAPAAPPHERVLPLQGGRNFRDLGGYRTRDGRHVKWGLLFRSGAMSGLTAADYAYLEKRGVRVVCDFRAPSERAAEPVAWPEPHAPRVLADDYDMRRAGIVPDPAAFKHATAQQARRKIAATYPRMLTAFNGQYRRMFGELLAGHAPLAFNCTAGKDRTGVAAALLLTALGVPRETVIQDYMLTNRYLDRRPVAPAADPAAPENAWMKLPPAVQQALALADRSYIEAVFVVLDRHAGGPEGYLNDELGLTPAKIRKLRQLYLE